MSSSPEDDQPKPGLPAEVPIFGRMVMKRVHRGRIAEITTCVEVGLSARALERLTFV